MKIENYSLLERTQIYLNQLKQKSPYNFTIYLIVFVVALMILVMKKS